MAKANNGALGKGLGALLQSNEPRRLQEISIGQISANPYQPRRSFDAQSLSELAASIKEHGLFQPIVVRPQKDGYELIAGERRWRAAKLAGLEKLPTLIRRCTEQEAATLALIENLQREDLNVMEEAAAYEKLLQEYQLQQAELAATVGKSRSHITNQLRLLKLAEPVQKLLADGSLTMGQARPLLVLSAKRQIELAQLIIDKQLSTRAVEQLLQQEKQQPPQKKKPVPSSDLYLREAQARLKLFFGVPVHIKSSGKKNKIEIDFANQAELENIIATLSDALEHKPPAKKTEQDQMHHIV